MFDTGNNSSELEGSNTFITPLYQTTKPTLMKSHVVFINSSTESRLDIYMTSLLGGPQTLLGSYLSPAAESVTSLLGGPQTLLGSSLSPAAESVMTSPQTVSWVRLSAPADTESVQTVDVCLPAGDHHVAFVCQWGARRS